MFSREITAVQRPMAPVSYLEAPGKTWTDSNGVVKIGRTTFEHCQIVGRVAQALLELYPTQIRNALFPAGSHICAACHDVGKVSPTFIAKIMNGIGGGATSTYPQLAGVNFDLESNWGGHAGVSEVTARELKIGSFVPRILGQHHGFAPPVRARHHDDQVFGGQHWHDERVALIDALKLELGGDWPEIKHFHQARAIAGLTTVSDWIASGKHFEDPSGDWHMKIMHSLDDAGFIAPLVLAGQSFEQIFGFVPNGTQELLLDSIAGPGVYILEAPMGIGKTEAALYAAYTQMARGSATGIYFALPTQLTSNKVFDRFTPFLQKILAPGCRHRDALLLHGAAWLTETEMGEDSRPGGSWFSQRKRGLLAPFAVGTIDQALMAAMNVKHGFVRAFGLAGKVVILDEVHTYDAYTGTILLALVDLLRELQCTVIILSATLSRARRQQLAGQAVFRDSYPLVTAAPNSGQMVESTESSAQLRISPTSIAVHLTGDTQGAIKEAIARAAAGQQVLWIENTVSEAQQRQLALAGTCTELGIEVGLVHSRYTPADRRINEDRWVDVLGKSGWDDRLAGGRILIGTQVLEQSIDIDADFLVTRFAPTDMLLQRIGRLWRHSDTPRPAGAVPETWILAPDRAPAMEDPKLFYGSTATIYSPYVLCRSHAVWESISALALPGDIRRLVEATYADQEEAGAMAKWLRELDSGDGRRWKGRIALQNLARATLDNDDKTQPESKALTRYADAPSVDVLLVRAISIPAGASASQVTLLNGETISVPLQRHMAERRQWKAISCALMNNVVSCHAGRAPAGQTISELRSFGLHHCLYLGGDDGDAFLRVAIVGPDGILSRINSGAAHPTYRFQYSADTGLNIEKLKD